MTTQQALSALRVNTALALQGTELAVMEFLPKPRRRRKTACMACGARPLVGRPQFNGAPAGHGCCINVMLVACRLCTINAKQRRAKARKQHQPFAPALVRPPAFVMPRTRASCVQSPEATTRS